MQINNIGVFIAILILIVMLLICHIMNTLYPYPYKRTTINTHKINTHKINTYINNDNDNKNTKNNSINMFNNIAQQKKTLPTQYNIITYDRQNLRIPCDNQAQIPCKIKQAQCKIKPNELSDSEMALIYKAAYEMTGNEILLRALNKKP